MRGNTTTSNFFRLLPGFIPAHAGNTVPYGHVPGLCQVHPRSRGEYDGVITSIGLNLGSPPLTRGIPCEDDRHDGTSRFTPAHAGNTWKYKNIRRSNQVHPRSRGEYERLLIWQHMPLGSPPLTRGIPPLAFRLILASRFTPAHAGNTLLPGTRKQYNKVHPRSRGEYQ